VGRRLLEPGASAFPEPWTLDLSAWAGRRVTIELATLPRANPWYDWVFVGTPEIAGRGATPRRVVVIGLDTARADFFGIHGHDRRTTPELDAFARSSIVFDRAWAPAPRTRPSFRTATTGRWPLEAVCATNVGAVFQQRGWATAGLIANLHLSPGFDFADGFDLWWLDRKARADRQVDRALGWLEEHRDQDSFLFLHVMDPHIPYRAPRELVQPFLAAIPGGPDPTLPRTFNRWAVYRWMREGGISEQRKATLRALYEGDLAFTSQQLGRFLQAVESLPGPTLIVIHSDHGEELFDHGGFEHNHTLYEELVRAVLWVRPPGGHAGGHRSRSPVSLADIAPTLYEFAGIADAPPSDGRSLLPAMRGDEGDGERALPLGHLQYDRERWGVVWKGMKYVLVTADGSEELYDLEADPREQENLAATADLTTFRSKLGEAHGIPVGPGFRIEVALAGSAPIRLRLPAEASRAGVLDPESIAQHRANLEFGETPEKTSADVGAVELAADRRSLLFRPGRVGVGTLYVLFDAPPEAAPGVERERAPLPLEAGRWASGDHRIRVAPGTIVIPPPGEAARIVACHGPAEAAGVSDADLRALEALGYVGEGGTLHPPVRSRRR
jgi:arylsulfatase A-like enzyme